jgi:hypothetical protein
LRWSGEDSARLRGADCSVAVVIVKTTAYFDAIRLRPDRSIIEEEWIERAIRTPLREDLQADGRIRRWARVPEMENRYLRVILLADGETVHNAFFDRRFVP